MIFFICVFLNCGIMLHFLVEVTCNWLA